MFTLDKRTIDSTGAYLIGQLTKFDPVINAPLQAFTWSRDVDLRNDIALGMEHAAFTLDSYSATNTNGSKAFIGKNTTTVGAVGADGKLIVQPITLWSQKAAWTVAELASAMAIGRPIDEQKLLYIQKKFQQDVNEMVYLGDSALGLTGLLNNAQVSRADAPNSDWSTATADQILADVNALLKRCYNAAAQAVAPTDLRLSGDAFSQLSSMKVSDAGNESVLSFVARNCLSNAINGRPLNIQPVKYLASGQAVSNKDRMVAYTKDPQYIQMPLVFPQRQQPVFTDVAQSVAYLGALGQIEIRYPETIAYSDFSL